MLTIEREIVEETVKAGDFFESVGFSKNCDPTDEDGDSTFDMSELDVEVLSDVGYNQIEALRWTKNEEYVELTYVTTYSNDVHSLKCSPDHIVKAKTIDEPFYEWRKVRNLKSGDFLKNSHNDPTIVSVVVNVENLNKSDRLCDLQVNTSHCYYTNDVLSHNSHWLVQIGAGGMLFGKNVVHYTMELSEPKIGVRYDSHFCDIDADDVIDNKQSIIDFYDNNKNDIGGLIIKEFPTNFATTFTLKAHIDRLSLQGFVPDLVIVDYADVMRSTRKFDSLRHELRQVYEDLRRMAGEMKVPVWTACFDGDTVVQSPFGDFKIKDMVGKKGFPVYAYNHETDKVEIKTVNDVYLSNESTEVWEVKLDNKKKIIATPTHKFMLRSGEYVELKDLEVGQSLMPLRRFVNEDGWEVVKQNDMSLSRVADLLDEWRNDKITKIEHAREQEAEKMRVSAHARACVTRYGSTLSERVQRLTDLASMCATWQQYASLSEEIPLRASKKKEIWENRSGDNHKVVAIRKKRKPRAVYNMEVDELHNYALGAGIIVKNSQSNKEGALSDIIDVTNMSEAFGKAMTADFIISISRKATEKALGVGRAFIAKNRAGKDGLIYPITINTARSKFELGAETVDLEAAKEADEVSQKRAMKETWKKIQEEKQLKLTDAHVNTESDSSSEEKKDDEDHND